MRTRLKIYKTIGRITPRPKEVRFARNIPQPRRLLFIFPLDITQYEESIYILRRLEFHTGGDAIQLAIPLDFKGLFPSSSHKVFHFPLYRGKLTSLLVDVLVARFKGCAYDAVINLNWKLNLPMALVISKIQTPKRIGFAGPLADELYNIHIEMDESGPKRWAYDQILTLCDLGPINDHPDYHQWG